ncbi:MAG: MgtC/SapB family protein [Rhodospirillaceae bacterium]|nr:MgtC/SapB family protein [Rhodospirillaceae bacterium]
MEAEQAGAGSVVGSVDFDFSHFDLRLATELIVALAIGLLIGLEREWRKQGDDDHARIGIRTFGFMGLLGGLAGTLQSSLGPWVAPAALLSLAALLVGDRRASGKAGTALLSEDLTTLVAAIVTALLGMLATTGAIELAVACAVIVVALLYAKPVLHGLVGKLTEAELKATVRFLVISLVILPVLPDQGYGPYQALNPRSTWLMVVMISAMSFIGYFAIRALGAAIGVLATGFFGGMVSSTATTMTFAKLASDKPLHGRMLAAGAILANAIMAARVVILSAVLAPPLALALALPLGLATSAAAGFVAVIWYQARRSEMGAETITFANPFELSQAIKFALLLAVILVLERFLSDKFGATGLYVLAGISGLADVDAITLSVARGIEGGGDLTGPVIAILLAVASNTLVKSIFILRAGGSFAVWSIAALAAMVAAAIIGVGLQQAYL